jgi:hypothetical protein
MTDTSVLAAVELRKKIERTKDELEATKTELRRLIYNFEDDDLDAYYRLVTETDKSCE